MMRALFSGVTGLDTNTLRMDVVGNNVANVNTIGFKRSRVTFEESVSQLLEGATGPAERLGGSNPTQVGTGTRVGSVDRIFSQGNLEQTGVETDLALQGKAFFILSDTVQNYYTRVGSFQLDGAGRLVDPVNHFVVQGFPYDRVSKTFSGGFGAIQVPVGQAEPANATTQIGYHGNLNADSEPAGTHAQSSVFYAGSGAVAAGDSVLAGLKADSDGIVDLLSAGDKVNYSATVGGNQVTGVFNVGANSKVSDLLTAVENTLNAVPGVDGITLTMDADGRIQLATPDKSGVSSEVTGLILQAQDSTGLPRDDFNSLAGMTTTQAAKDPGTFSEETTVYDSLGFSHVVKLDFTRVLGANQFTWTAEVDGGKTPILVGSSGRVTFNNDGSLSGFFFDPVGDVLPTKLSISPTSGAKTPLEIDLEPGTIGGFDGITMLKAGTTLEASQDGFTQGTMVDFRIDREGTVSARFSNGISRPVGKLALAEFVNPVGLLNTGGSNYQATVNSGEALVGTAGASITADIVSGSIEQSNVDLAREFSNMILAQRGFQASARVITTSDEVLSELLNIKR
ncbi:MAG: flagellar hook-basal body complex protein [Candidatus Eisenbacteria bacterium]